MYVFIYIELWVCGFMVVCMCAIVLILGCAFIVVLMMYIGLCLCIMHCWIYIDYCVCIDRFRLYLCILHLYICCVLYGNYLCILIIVSVYFCVFMGNIHMVYDCMWYVCVHLTHLYLCIFVYLCILIYLSCMLVWL